MISISFVWLFICLALGSVSARNHQQCKSTLTTVSGRAAPSGQLCKGQLIFEENFDELDLSTWKYEVNMLGGGNGEFQWYTRNPRNSFVNNSILTIQPTLTIDEIPDLTNCHIVLEDCNDVCERICTVNNIAPPVQSARLISEDGFAFKYGRVEIRAKMPTGDWLWPAMWLMPHKSVYGGWPRSGEIDFMESRGNTDMFDWRNEHMGVERTAYTLNFGTNYTNSAWWAAHGTFNTPAREGFNTGYHLYEMEWAPTHFSFSIDNVMFGKIYTENGFFELGEFTGYNPWTNGSLNAPFDQEFFFILNVAVGGTSNFFPDGDENLSGKPWHNDAPYAARDFWNGRDQWLPSWNFNSDEDLTSAMQVDYIKVYAI